MLLKFQLVSSLQVSMSWYVKLHLKCREIYKNKDLQESVQTRNPLRVER